MALILGFLIIIGAMFLYKAVWPYSGMGKISRTIFVLISLLMFFLASSVVSKDFRGAVFCGLTDDVSINQASEQLLWKYTPPSNYADLTNRKTSDGSYPLVVDGKQLGSLIHSNSNPRGRISLLKDGTKDYVELWKYERDYSHMSKITFDKSSNTIRIYYTVALFLTEEYVREIGLDAADSRDYLLSCKGI